jgi:dTDP-glucose 4,6-dehydratase
MRERKILITGGAGFIGSEFVKQAVKTGHKAIIVDAITYAGDVRRLKEVKDKFSFYKVDIRNRDKLKSIFYKEKPDTVVHFAAATHVDRSIVDPDTFIDTNVKGTQVLLDIARKSAIDKFIHVSTDEVYGEIKKGSFSENSPLVANSPYAVSKAAADMLVRAYGRTYGLPVIVVRPCNNYGPWQYPEKVIPVVIMSALNKKKIPVYGKGLNVREWLCVRDCADAILSVLEKGKICQVYNIGSGCEERNIDLVNLICGMLDKIEPIISSKSRMRSYKAFISFVKDRPGHDFRYSLNSQKVFDEVGWKAKTRFQNGLETTIRWFVLNKAWWSSKK